MHDVGEGAEDGAPEAVRRNGLFDLAKSEGRLLGGRAVEELVAATGAEGCRLLLLDRHASACAHACAVTNSLQNHQHQQQMQMVQELNREGSSLDQQLGR